jgi:AraC family transcriptional regulator, exoenzyme S synthesis regulatory protein ExsA
MANDKNCFYIPNIAFFSGSRKEHAQDEFVQEHVLTHVVAGEVRFSEADKETIARAGETILFRRNLLVKCEKRHLADGSPFKVVNFVLERQFLEQYAVKHNVKRTVIPPDHKPVLVLQPKAPLLGLLHSVYPYFETAKPMSKDMLYLKLNETILALLEQEEELDSWLFGNPQEGKIDLGDFMHRNYMFNVPMTKFAELTGRSLSTFQRDFHRIFGTNAAAWLLKRRLQAAHHAITTKQQKPVDIYLDLGFEDIAHFSRTFKNEFGYNPSHLKEMAAGQ